MSQVAEQAPRHVISQGASPVQLTVEPGPTVKWQNTGFPAQLRVEFAPAVNVQYVSPPKQPPVHQSPHVAVPQSAELHSTRQ